MDGVVVEGDRDTALAQLSTKSYRSGTRHRRRCVELGDPRRQLRGRQDLRPPDPLSGARVERREDLAAKAVLDDQALPLRPRLADPAADRVERADAARRQPQRRREALGGRDPDPQAGKGAGPEADRDEVDGAPAAGRRSRRLDLGQQAGGMPGPPLRGATEQRLVQDLAVAPGAGRGVGSRGVETDYDQGCASLNRLR